MTDSEPPQFHIREARPSDAAELAAFIEPFVQERKLLRRTENELEVLVEHGFIAEREGRIVGFAALEIYSPKLAELRSLAVAAEMQGLGVGKKLVQACIDRAHERRVLEVMAISSSEAFFLSCGFDFTLPNERKAFFIQTRDSSDD